MWVLLAFGSAFFAGLTAILAKCGIRRTDSTVATALRTVVVLAVSWGMVLLTGAQGELGAIDSRTLLFLILSGLATGASWLCYYRALQLGEVSRVAPIDKSSTVLTMLLAAVFLHERITATGWLGMALIALGTLLMLEKRNDSAAAAGSGWLWYALGSSAFASLTTLLGKLGIAGVDANLGTAIRTGVVLLMSWLLVLVQGKQKKLREVSGKELLFIGLSGLATGASWLCYYRALQSGPASVVVPIDKLSILVTVVFSGLVLHEHLGKRAAAGLAALTAGTLLMLV